MTPQLAWALIGSWEFWAALALVTVALWAYIVGSLCIRDGVEGARKFRFVAYCVNTGVRWLTWPVRRFPLLVWWVLVLTCVATAVSAVIAVAALVVGAVTLMLLVSLPYWCVKRIRKSYKAFK